MYAFEDNEGVSALEIDKLADELKGYAFSKGALRFEVDRALPASLVQRLVEVRLRQAFRD